MYLGDPREQQICICGHTTWEADNRVETRYMWMGKTWDLCDMDPEEYDKTIFRVQEYEPGLISNPLVTTFDDKDYTIEFPYSPTTSLVMVIKDSDGNENTFTIPKGSVSPIVSALTTVDSSKISTIYIGDTYTTATSPIFSDTTYKYSVIKKIVIKDHVKYVANGILHADLNSIIASEATLKQYLTEATVSGNTSEFSYFIPVVEKYGLLDKTSEEILAFLESENRDLLFISYTEMTMVEMGGLFIQTNEWTKIKDMTIDGIPYHIYIWYGTRFCNVHDPKYESGYTTDEYSYKITVE